MFAGRCLYSALRAKQTRLNPDANRLLKAAFSAVAAQGGGTLVLGEHFGGKLAPTTLSTLAAAGQIGAPITLMLAGPGAAAAAQAGAGVQGVRAVLVAEDAALDHGAAEAHAGLLQAAHKRHVFAHILAPASTFGKNVLPRAAALLGVQPLSDVIRVLDPATFVRPVYAGNALATVKFDKAAAGGGPCMLTVRSTGFQPASAGSTAAPIEAVPADDISSATSAPGAAGYTWLAEERRASERPELGSAKVVVSGGRALKTADNFKHLERIADILGGAVGATRAAVDAGMVPNDLQVGQTGKVVAPDLYIALGISGAIQHLAGMKDSRVIVAINTDGDAPIFQSADYGLTMDLFEALPQLEKALADAKAKKAAA